MLGSCQQRKQLMDGLFAHNHSKGSLMGSLRDHSEYTGVAHLLDGHKENIFI